MTDNRIQSLLAQVEAYIDTLCTSEPSPLQHAVRDHFSAGGNRLRARLALDAGIALELPKSIIVAVASGCELLHNASLVHDDLQDKDMMRRNAPAIWAAHGADTAICSGDLMLSAAYAALAQAGTHAADLIVHTHHRVAHVISGQCDDLRLAGRCDQPEEYERVAAAKSGPLLALPLELSLLAAGRQKLVEPARRCATFFAISYQMLDDLVDAERDLANGTLNAVAVYAAAGASDAREAVRLKAMAHLTAFEHCAEELPSGLAQTLVARAAPIKVALHSLEPQLV